ncbi:MAG: aldo/keto reductase [Acutalibacteraceae bacterium]|jgi:predicted aldo/keto reductase-like oxidoreductase
MQYRKDKYGHEISILGYGCMRFTQTNRQVDLDKAEREILIAYNAGVNYFDTAYIYPGSEAALGEILRRNGIRDKVTITTKLPHYMIRSTADLDKYFHEQLARLQTDHVEYYLMHMLNDEATWDKLRGLGILDWLKEKKQSGTIGQVGFSYHGGADEFCRLIDAYDWDICQIQYNYMDEYSQAGRRGLDYAHKKGIPVVIMEPLRGGRLVSRLPESAKRIFAAHPVAHTPAQWAFRWLWDQPQVTCVLSGMNSEEMVRDNVQTASEAAAGELTDADKRMLSRVVDAINARMKVGCTGCGYCMPCPRGVDIPGAFSAYNRRYSESRFWAMKDYFMCTALRRESTAASQCIGCGKCERHCPQHIPIRKQLKQVSRHLEGPVYKLARWIVKRKKIY